MFQRTLFFKMHRLSQQLLLVACTSIEASSGLFGQIGLPKLIRHWQGTAVPVSPWIEHHALQFASDALLCGTYITKTLNCHLNCALKVPTQEVLVFASCLHAEHISGQSVALLNQLCQFVPHQVVHDSFLFWTSVKFLAGESTCIEKTKTFQPQQQQQHQQQQQQQQQPQPRRRRRRRQQKPQPFKIDKQNFNQPSFTLTLSHPCANRLKSSPKGVGKWMMPLLCFSNQIERSKLGWNVWGGRR